MDKETYKKIYNLEETPFDVSFASLLAKRWKMDQIDSRIMHIHPEGQEGATSSGGHCVLKQGLKQAKVKLPELTGLKLKKGAMTVGSWIHEISETDIHKEIERFSEYYEETLGWEFCAELYCVLFLTKLTPKEILKKIETTDSYLGFMDYMANGVSYLFKQQYFEIPEYERDLYEPETLNWSSIPYSDELLEDFLKFYAIYYPRVFVELGIPIMISPLDLAFVSVDDIVYTYLPFGNGDEAIMRLCPVLKPGGEYKLICDIKNASSFSFYKEGKIPVNYACQFEKYMRATHLPSILIVYINKVNAEINEISIPTSDNFS